LHEKQIVCWRCAGLPYRCQQGDKRPAIERLVKLVYGGPARLHPRPGRMLDRRVSLEISLRWALIRQREKRVKGWKG
jgi:hypothetical protein